MKLPNSRPISLRSLHLGDFNIPSLAFLIFYIYQYLFPQYFLPFLFKLQIPTITVGICILFAILGWRRERIRHAAPVIWSFILLGLLFFLARFFVTAPEPTKFYFNEHLHMVAVGMVMLYYFKDTQKIHLLIVMMIFFGTFSGLIAVREGGLIWGHDFLQDENQTSAMMSMLIPLTVFYSVFARRTLHKVMCYLALAVQVAEVVVSVSRGGFLALLVVGLCLLMFTRRKLMFFILISIAVIGILSLAPPRFFNEIKTLKHGTQEATAGARIEYWRRATIMFSENPLLGKGIAQFPILSHKYARPGDILDRGNYNVCHSNWFQVLSELGIIGCCLYLLIFYHFFIAAVLIIRRYRVIGERRLGKYEYGFYRNIANGLFISMIGFIVAGSFINILIFPFFYTYVFLMMLLKTTFLEKISTVQTPVGSPAMPDV